MSAKFESRCPKCKGKISPGDPITGMKGSYSHVSCPERPAPPPNPNDRVVGGVTYRKKAYCDIEDPDGGATYDWSRVEPDGSLHALTGDEARSLGLPLDEQEEFAAGVTTVEDEEEFGLSDTPVPVPFGDDEDEWDTGHPRPDTAPQPVPQPPDPKPIFPGPPRPADPIDDPALRKEFSRKQWGQFVSDDMGIERLASQHHDWNEGVRGAFYRFVESRRQAATAA